MKQALLLPGFLALFSFLYGQNENLKVIELKNIPITYKPARFFIADVVDLRSNRTTVGYTDVGLFNKRYRADLKHGAETAIKNYLAVNLSSDTALVPVIMKINELTISESRSLRTGEVGSCTFVATFDSKIQGMPQVNLGEITVNLSQSTLNDISSKHESQIRQALEDACKELDRYIAKNENHPALIRGVKIFVREREAAGSSDTLFYKPNRPLTYEDFHGKPDKLSKAAAVTYSGFYFSGSADIKNQFLDLNILINPFVVRSGSWMREIGRNEYLLAHEQLHFDISRLCALELRKEILSTNFSLFKYQETLDSKARNAIKRMTDLQAQYDEETRHGLDKKLQLYWKEKIKMELLKLSE